MFSDDHKGENEIITERVDQHESDKPCSQSLLTANAVEYTCVKKGYSVDNDLLSINNLGHNYN